MRKGLVLVSLLIVACVAGGCVTYSGGIAPSTAPLEAGSYTVMGKQGGTSWGVMVLGLPFCQASTSQALTRATRGADALIQVTVDNRTYYLLLLHLQRIRVEGRAVRVGG